MGKTPLLAAPLRAAEKRRRIKLCNAAYRLASTAEAEGRGCSRYVQDACVAKESLTFGRTHARTDLEARYDAERPGRPERQRTPGEASAFARQCSCGPFRKRLRSPDVTLTWKVSPSRWSVSVTATPASPSDQTRRK